MKNNLFFKIFSGYVLTAALLTGLIVFFSFAAIRRHFIAAETKSLNTFGESLNLSLSPLLADRRIREINTRITALDRQTQRRITVIASDGTVLADSRRKAGDMPNHAGRSEVAEVLKGGIGTSIRFSSTVEQEMLYVALPMKNDENVTGVLRVSVLLKDISVLTNRLGRSIMNAAALILLVALAAALVLSRTITRPLEELSRATRRIAVGDFDTRVFVPGNGEIHQVAADFNEMTEKVRSLFDTVSRQKGELSAILSAQREGVCVVDPSGMIVRANHSFESIIGDTAVEGRYCWELLRDPGFEKMFSPVRKGEKTSADIPLEINNRFYLCGASALPANSGHVITLHDITEARELVQMKKDLVTNVSHELRTPLTAIKGFVETMEENAREEDRHYLEIIRRHTTRLISIVKDLLTLSELEAGGQSLEKVPVDFKRLIEDCVHAFDQRIREKGLALEMTLPDGLPAFPGNPFKLEQVMINLIDNAVKYTEKGVIRITLQRSDAALEIGIIDSGIGIPREHLTRVFERFYVVDKSRSRKAGGTGLGLSIVKHIVLLHGGTIAIDSAPGAGTRVSLRFPSK